MLVVFVVFFFLSLWELCWASVYGQYLKGGHYKKCSTAAPQIKIECYSFNSKVATRHLQMYRLSKE